MASNPKLDSSSSSPDGVAYGSQRSNYSKSSNLERSGAARDGHDGRLDIGTGLGGGAGNSSGAGNGAEHSPLCKHLLLDIVTIEDQSRGRHSELKRAINAVVSTPEPDPSLGTLQSKPLHAFGPEELKRLKASLLDCHNRAKDRKRNFNDAIVKLDKFFNSLQSRKRSRPDTNASGPTGPSTERSLSSLGVGERTVASVHTTKSHYNIVSPHSSAAEVAMQKVVDKNKRVVPNKRVRTSMADTRQPDGRPSNTNLPRTSISTDRERDIARPTNSLASPAEERERVVGASSEGWEKTKMKGRRSGAITKVDVSAASVRNETPECDREHKWSGQQHRMNTDNRARPSEGHGFRSGPVHGITSVHKAETSAQLNGLPVRGGNKVESESIPVGGDRAERISVPDRERNVSKRNKLALYSSPPVREESHTPTPVVLTKTKAARAPRSGSSAGGSSSHLARSSSFAENRDRHAPPPKAQVQTPTPVPSGSNNRKRPAPSRSSSPPAQLSSAPSWSVYRQMKVARSARRVNVIPGTTSTREEPPAITTEQATRDNAGPNVSSRSNPGLPSATGVARRVSATSSNSHPPIKPKSERVTSYVGLSESEESDGNGDKVKEKVKKQGDSEQKPPPPALKMAGQVVPAKKTRVVAKDEGGDGVRRQGRSGRGAVGPRTNVVTTVEKLEVSANAKQLRSVRTGPEKQDRTGRPPTKKDVVDRKPLTRPRRPIGNGISEVSGESDDDVEELANAVRMAVNASEAACSGNFWKQVEPYFAYLTPTDLAFLQQLTRSLQDGDPALQIPPCNDQYGKMETIKNTPPVSPILETGGKLMTLANGNIENDGFVTKLFHNLKDKHDGGKAGRKGINCGWLDKMLPLSQRLLAALINEGDLDEARRRNDENCQEDSSDGPREESPFRGSLTGNERMDGESDGDFGRRDLERWSSVVRETYATEGQTVPNGLSSRFGINLPREDLSGEGDDILANTEVDTISYAGHLEIGNGDDILGGSSVAGKEDLRGMRSFATVAGMTAWEIQYQRMPFDDRILLELQSYGTMPELLSDVSQREDDEICEELRKMQRELKEQVCLNKDRATILEKTILSKREVEERDRERFAIDKLIEIAYSRRMGSRTSPGGKSAASKGAKSAGLAFAKRVLAKVRAFEGGQSCFDSVLRDILFCVAPKESESSVALSGGNEVVAPTTSLTSETAAVTSAALQAPKPAVTLSGEVSGGRPVARRIDGKSEKDFTEIKQKPPTVQSTDRVKGKEDGWPLRTKEREVLLEDVGGVSSMRDVNGLGTNVLGGTKGKRSERERESKGHGTESLTRIDNLKGARQGVANVKSERKSKTKPRQKTAPLSKAVNGLLATPTTEPGRDLTTVASSSQQAVMTVTSIKERVEVVHPGNQTSTSNMEDVVDLSNIPIPGIDDLGVSDMGTQGQDLGLWLPDFEEDVHLNPDDNCLMGLEVPMDDLSDLGLMM